MANLVRRMSFKGKKMDTLRIPMPVRGEAFAKAAATAVTIQAQVDTDKTIVIDKHYEYSKLIEDITEVQSLSSMRRFYTDDAGYALAKRVDTDLIQLGRLTNGGAGTAVYANAFIGGDGTTAYNSASTGNASALTDAAIRRTIQRLDDVDADNDGRHLVIPPSSRNTLMGLSRFTEQAFVGETGSGNTIRSGKIGELYGIDVHVTSNCDTASVASGTAPRICLMFQKDAFVLAEQMAVRSQTQYKQEYLATLYTADTIYGVKLLRGSSTTSDPDAATAFALAVPA